MQVIRLSRTFGCHTGLRLAAAVVNGGGYYQDLDYYCRWGQGGTRPVRVNHHTYVPGFCQRSSNKREMTFLARRLPRSRSCGQHRVALGIRATRVTCRRAFRVTDAFYRAFFRVTSSGTVVTFPLKAAGFRCWGREGARRFETAYRCERGRAVVRWHDVASRD